MTPPTRAVGCVLGAAASILILSGCFGVPSDDAEPATPSPAASVSASPSPTQQPLTIPERTAGELSRIVFAAEGLEGVPTSEGEIGDAPMPGVNYTVEAVCTTRAGVPAVQAQLLVSTTDDPQAPVMTGTLTCDGDPWLMSGEIPSASPVQATFGVTDGINEGYVRILPTEEYVSSQ